MFEIYVILTFHPSSLSLEFKLELGSVKFGLSHLLYSGGALVDKEHWVLGKGRREKGKHYFLSTCHVQVL